MAPEINSESMSAVHEAEKERNRLNELGVFPRVRHQCKDLSSESSVSESASFETNPIELRMSEDNGFQERIEPNEDSIALNQFVLEGVPASSFTPGTTSLDDEAVRYLSSLSFKDVTSESRSEPDSMEMPHQRVAKEERDDDDSEEDPIIARVPKAYRVRGSRFMKADTREYAVPEQADESNPPPIRPSVLRTMRLLEADYALFRALEVRGSKSCLEHCPPKGDAAFCFCTHAYCTADLEDQILTKLDFVME